MANRNIRHAPENKVLLALRCLLANRITLQLPSPLTGKSATTDGGQG